MVNLSVIFPLLSKKNNEIRLLFTMQSKQSGSIMEPLEDGLIELIAKHDELIKEKGNKNFSCKIRIHPNEIETGKAYLKERLKHLYFSPILKVTSKNDNCFYEDLIWSTHHLTCFSSCSIEANLFNVNSAVYGSYAYEIYKDEIEDNILTFFQKPTQFELIKWMTENKTTLDKATTKFINDKLPNPIQIFN